VSSTPRDSINVDVTAAAFPLWGGSGVARVMFPYHTKHMEYECLFS